jgi:uncharacterized membrane protein YecN with MAPEG domain
MTAGTPGIPTITALYGSLNAVLNIALALRVSNLRRKHRVSVGQGESKELLVAIRVHGNNAEFVPLAIMMLLLAELCGGSSLWLHMIGGSLLVARVGHAVGMGKKAPNVPRFSGSAITWTGIVVTALYTLWLRTKS